MKDFREQYGAWALVAGAAEGLGEAYCKALAGRHINILMIDKREKTMQDLSERLKLDFGIETLLLGLDLVEKEASTKIMDAISGLDCRLMIYNAAYSPVRPFLENTADELDYHLNVNSRSVFLLVHAFATKMKERGPGGILLMSSLAGLWGTNLVAAYGATKAFNINLAEGLHHELKPYGIDVMVCIAGATATPTYFSTRPEYGLIRPSVMDPEKVAEGALRNLGKRALFIPGFSNRLTYFFCTRILPRRMAAGLFNHTMAGMYRKR